MLSICVNNFSVNESRANYDKAFQNFPQKEMYRLFIDKNKQHLGEDAFDKKQSDYPGEPGYKAAMSSTFASMRDRIGQRKDADYLIQLHKKCTEGVEVYKYVPGNYGYDYREIENGFKAFRSYGFNLTKATCEATMELEEEKLLIISDQPNPDYLSYYKNGRVYSSYSDNVKETQVRDKVNFLFNRYYSELEKSNNKIRPIVRLCRALQMYHVFDDGNGRTIGFALLDELLMENGFTPCILEDPSLFCGGYCEIEMEKHVRTGMENFKSFKIKA